MRIRAKRIAMIAGLVAAGGFLLAGPATSCTSFTGRALLTASDFCFIFDCQNGLLGGTVDPCSGTGGGNQTIEGQDSPPIFRDCPSN